MSGSLFYELLVNSSYENRTGHSTIWGFKYVSINFLGIYDAQKFVRMI